MIRKGLLALAILGVAWFALQGGEFGTWDIFTQRQKRARLEREIDSLQTRVDSLRKYRARLDTDRVLLEKLARENVGMVRGDKELLYLIGPKDTTRSKPPD